MNSILSEDVEGFDTKGAVSRIISGIYENKDFKAILDQYPDVKSLKESLTNDLTSFLSRSFGQENSSVLSDPDKTGGNSDLQERISRLEDQIKTNKSGSFSINWPSLILIIIIVGLVYVLLKSKINDIEERTDRHRKELSELADIRDSGFFKNPNNQNESFGDFKRSVEDNITGINSAVRSLQNDINGLLLKSGQQAGQDHHSKSAPPAEIQPKFEILYAPIPNRDGSFTAAKVTNIEDQSSSFYKFTIKDTLSQRASFEFLNVERAIKDATSSPELILNPVCKIKNALNQNARKIKTIVPGIVVKQNDKWVVDKPAEIEYE